MSIQENYTTTLEKYQGEQENCWYFYNMTQKQGCGVISLIDPLTVCAPDRAIRPQDMALDSEQPSGKQGAGGLFVDCQDSRARCSSGKISTLRLRIPLR